MQRESELPQYPTDRFATTAEAATPDIPIRQAEEGSSELTLVEKHESLKEMLLTPSASRFKGKDVRRYIYLTTTVVEAPSSEETGIPVDTLLWNNVLSNNPTRIEAAIGQIDDRQKPGYIRRLLAMVEDETSDNLAHRMSAATALGMLGDPRLGEAPLYEMDMVEVSEGEFTMGSDDGRNNEKPQRSVYVDAFEIAKYPLTNQKYKAFIDETNREPPQHWNGRDFPIGKANPRWCTLDGTTPWHMPNG